MVAPIYSDLADVPTGGTAHWVMTPDGIRLRFAHWPGSGRGTILLFPGRTEYIEKYGRVVTRLRGLGFGVVVIDWRGQGLSTRIDDSTAVGHVDDYDEYQTDIDAVINHPALADIPKPLFLMAHSMGGLIGLRAVHNRLPVAGAIFFSPLWGIHKMPIIAPIVPAIARGLNLLGLGKFHVPGADSSFYIQRQGYDGNELTSCPETYAWLKTQIDTHPELGLGGPGIAWVDASCRETRFLAQKHAPHPPFMTLYGCDERVVDPGAIEEFHRKTGSPPPISFKSARHELLMETPKIQQQVWAEIEKFFSGLSAV